MKRHLLLACLLSGALVLTACAGQATATASGGDGGTNGFRGGNGSGTFRNLSPEAKLALGTLKLEGTSQAVDPKMAAELIPLWQLMAQLDSSTSSAPQEVTATMDQIKQTMVAGQVNTIEHTTLTQADLFSVFQQQSDANGSSGSGGSGFGGGGNNRGGGVFFFGGGGPGGGPGGPPGGGFGGGGFRAQNGGGASSTTTTGSQLTAAQAAAARENAISTLLINQLVRLLETKVSR